MKKSIKFMLLALILLFASCHIDNQAEEEEKRVEDCERLFLLCSVIGGADCGLQYSYCAGTF